MELTVNKRFSNNIEVMEKVKLVDVADIIAGQSPPSDTYNKDKVGIPFFQGKADFGYQNPTPRTWCSKPLKIAEPLDILVSVRAPVGSVNINTENACIGRGIMSVRAKKRAERRHASREKLIHQKYLYYYFIKFEEQIEALGTGSTFKAIKKSELENLEIPLPPLSTQQKIAEILDTADQLRQYNKQLIEKYDALTQSLFLDMFGDPVRNEKGWETKTIEELTKKEKGSIKRGPFGGALKKEIFVEKGYLVYEQFHALNNDFSMARYFINEEKFNELKGFEVKPGDIIISCSGVYLGKLAIVPQNAKKGIINQALLKVTLDETIIRNDFFIFHFTHKNFREKYFDANRGAGIPNFPPMSDFKKFPFISPPFKLQNQFAERVQMIETQKQQAQEALAKSEALFQGLLQQAFKGELV